MAKSQAFPARTPIRATADHLHSAAIHLLRRLRKEDDASGLSAPRLSALSVIVFLGPIKLKDLAAAEQVRPPTMTHIVAALKKEGLIKVRTSLADARAIRISATPHGIQRLEQGRARRLDSLSSKLTKLALNDRGLLDQAASLMERLARMPD